MSYRHLVLGAAALLALTACDAVKVPGLNPAGSDQPGPHGPTAEAPPPPAEPRPEDRPADTTPGTPDTTPDPGPGTATLPAPANYTPIDSLAALNASPCGLAGGSQPTPTLSAQAEALTGPQPESLATIQAVGAIAVSSLTPFPGIVKMEPRRFEGNAIASGHCAATRIAERWFVTAAHCVDDNYDEIQFIAGTTNLRDMAAARIFSADAAICHAGYAGRETNFINDLALVRVPEEALPALTEVPVAEYGLTDRPFGAFHYPIADMAGWGVTGFNQPLSPRLLSAELSIISTSPGTIVIASRDGAGPCIGDSGGPLYVTETDGQRTLIGVLSVVEQASGSNLCEGAYRGRYTNIAGYRDWIDAVLTTCRRQPELCFAPAMAPPANPDPANPTPAAAPETSDAGTQPPPSSEP